MLLSVLVITYNNKDYVEQCLNSICLQKHIEPFELIIAEDCSADGTKSIIKDWLETKRLSGNIHVTAIFNDTNQGVTKNFANGVLACKGKYIIPIAGDDYFASPYVFAHLLDYMESHPEVVIYSINAIQYFQNDHRINLLIQDDSFKVLRTKDLLIGNPVGGGVIFRNLVREFPSIYLESEAEDRQMWYMLSQYGEIHLNPWQIGKVYRRHGASITMRDKRSREEKIKLRILDNEKWREYLFWVTPEEFDYAQKVHYAKLLREQIRRFKLVSAYKTLRALKRANSI